MRIGASLVVAFALVAACGGGGGQPDADEDGISDSDEGAPLAVDTDGDGVADFRDRDADDDTLPDALEAGDGELATAPADSDGDGVADFRDVDSDGNGRADRDEGQADTDGDGARDFADADDDGDELTDRVELGVGAALVDTDGDGVADFRDADSDGDTIGDLAETHADYDGDGVANFRDADSDGDCRPDRLEHGGPPARDSDGDRRPDFLDRDSDADGVADQDEDADCNGRREGTETDALRGDSDGDGVSDLIEREAGTNPNDLADSPRTRGDFVFVMPHQATPSPGADTLDFQPALSNLDVYVLVDRSVSMADETTSIKDTLGAVIRGLQCPPQGTGDAASCIPNLQAGLAGIGYVADQPFTRYLPIQPAPNFAAAPISNVTGTPPNEPMVFGLWTAVTNASSAEANAAYGCGLAEVSANPACPAGTFGQACFRPDALPVLVLATDESPLSGQTTLCPGWEPVARAALAARKARVVGVVGSGSAGSLVEVRLALRAMATETGAVDGTASNEPLVFDGADAGAATAIGNGLRALARGVPLDMGARVIDLGGDAVDTRAAFVAHLETSQLGTTRCASGLVDRDSDGDGRRDLFVGARAGMRLCWKLSVKQNTTVPALDRPQLYRARVEVTGDGVTVVASRNVFFLVPPRQLDEPIE